MDSATEKLELGLQRLAKAGDDADLLGLALQSIHGALEDYFRARLAADSHVPADQRAALADPKKAQWKDLLDAMQLYGDLSARDRELIWRSNMLRTKVAHGGRYTGTRADLERYAALAQALSGYTMPPQPARPAPQPPRRLAEKPAQSLTGVRSASGAPEIPRAVRSGPAAAPPRSRSGWPGGLIALALLVALALFVVLRGVAQPLAGSAAAPTSAATAAPEAAALPDVAAPTADALTADAIPTPLPRGATVNAQDGVNLRQDHTKAAATLAALGGGTRVTIVGGPIQADGYTWWNVEVDGQRGWCAGEFLTFDRT